MSWPQCDRDLPERVPFAVVGVNGGTAATTNVCLADQLSWAARSTTGAVPASRAYSSTSTPAIPVTCSRSTASRPGRRTTWTRAARTRPAAPTRRGATRTGSAPPRPVQYRGSTNDLACSWQYGWNRAVEAVDDRFAPAARAAGISDAAPDYTWWLDVETMNSWQQGDAGRPGQEHGHPRGHDAALRRGRRRHASGCTRRATSGARSSGGRSPGRSRPPRGRRRTCSADRAGWPGRPTTRGRGCAAPRPTGLTGGPVTLVQYIVDDLDRNRSCV